MLQEICWRKEVSSSTGIKETPALQSEQERPRQTISSSNGSVAPVDEIQGTPSPGRRVDGDGETSYEDIWRHIHSLMQMNDAARAACLSHAFLSSWRCYPKLILSRGTFRLAPRAYEDLSGSIDSILRNHSGVGLKILKLNLYDEDITFPYMDSWLQVAVTPGIEELTLILYKQYKFPCSILSHGVRNSIRSLQLGFCAFHPTPELGPLRSLTRLRLRDVPITGDELECLLSNSLALEHLDLDECKGITFLKIPAVLLQLSYLNVFGCWNLQVIENKAPRLSRFTLFGSVSKLSLGEALQTMKEFDLSCENAIHYARAKLPFVMPNLESLLLYTDEVDTPMPPTKFVNLKHKFVNLKHLGIQISGAVSPSYDYFSLISFLDASPCLETWWLDVCWRGTEHESVFGSPWHLRQLPERRHDHLKSLEIGGFSSAKSLVELTVCILKSAVSLEEITLDTLHGGFRCSGGNNSDCRDDYDFCSTISSAGLEEAYRGVVAIRKYIEDKVPPTVELKVVEPCPRCHTSSTVDDT